jgi:N-acetylglucosamine kinase-like BadF-type ATPase
VRHVVGIDAGGTKTIGLLADENGQVLGQARGGGANLQTNGELEVEKVLHGLLESLGSEHPIDALCLGIAGVDRPRDEALIRGILRRLGHRDRTRVVHDAAIALVAGAPGRMGIVVLAGTGSMAYGVDPQGRTARAGGYGYLLADEGSGYWVGHQALRAAVRATDGRGAPTVLATLILEALGVTSLAELVPRIYEQGLGRHEIAALAGRVQEAAGEGDSLAAELLEQAAAELALAAAAVGRQLSFGEAEFPLVLAGGLFKACPTVGARLRERVALEGARPSLLEVEPARGAVTLALDLLA